MTKTFAEFDSVSLWSLQRSKEIHSSKVIDLNFNWAQNTYLSKMSPSNSIENIEVPLVQTKLTKIINHRLV